MTDFFGFLDAKIARSREDTKQKKAKSAYQAVLSATEVLLRRELEQNPMPSWAEDQLQPLRRETPSALLERYQNAAALHGELHQVKAYRGTLTELSRVATFREDLATFPVHRLPSLLDGDLREALPDSRFLQNFVRHAFSLGEQSPLKELHKTREALEVETNLLSRHGAQTAFKNALRDLVQSLLEGLRSTLAEHCGVTASIYQGMLRDLGEAETVLKSAQGSRQSLVAAQRRAIGTSHEIHLQNMHFYEQREASVMGSLRASFITLDDLQTDVEAGRLTPIDLQAFMRYQMSEENALRRYLYSIAELFTQAEEVVDTSSVESMLLLFGQLPKRRRVFYENVKDLTAKMLTLPLSLYVELLQQEEYNYSVFAYERLGAWFQEGSKTSLSFYSLLRADEVQSAIPQLVEREQHRLNMLKPTPSKGFSFLDRVEEDLADE